MKRKSASKKRNQVLKEEIIGLNKTIANMTENHREELRTIRKMIECSYYRWLRAVTSSDAFKMIQREHPMLQWGQPLRLSAIKGYALPPEGYPNGRLGWHADSLYFATRIGQDRHTYRFYKECKEMGLLVGCDDADYEYDEPTPWEVSHLDANEQHVHRWHFGDEERRQKILALLERAHGSKS